MKTTFLKSVTAGIVGLTLLSGCAQLKSKMGMHKCSGNSCNSKKESKASETTVKTETTKKQGGKKKKTAVKVETTSTSSK
jgi:hypothetical protein